MVKQEVLAALDAVRGRYISGQELAAQLGVSRTAVWKAVAALRRDGIPIKAVTNRGYTLAQSVDVLNAAAVAVQLDEATVKALQIEVVDRLPGTNVALRSRADAGAREGLVLIAQAQSAGRGRGGHSFYSPPGGLYMSILLRPEARLHGRSEGGAEEIRQFQGMPRDKHRHHHRRLFRPGYHWHRVCTEGKIKKWLLHMRQPLFLTGSGVLKFHPEWHQPHRPCSSAAAHGCRPG